jgi:hypothetical protein
LQRLLLALTALQKVEDKQLLQKLAEVGICRNLGGRGLCSGVQRMGW